MAEKKKQANRAYRPFMRAMLATFASSLTIYVVNHATELHIAPWAAAILAGIAATVTAATHNSEGTK